MDNRETGIEVSLLDFQKDYCTIVDGGLMVGTSEFANKS